VANPHSSKDRLCQGTDGAGFTDTKRPHLGQARLCLGARVVSAFCSGESTFPSSSDPTAHPSLETRCEEPR
jgi:hypothetical protein